MIKVVTVEKMRTIEAAADKSVMPYAQMMLDAGRAASEYLLQRLPITSDTRITLLIGKGNNGGDGLVVAHHLAQNSSAQIRIYLLESRPADDPNYQAVLSDNLLITNADDDHDKRVLKNMIHSADIIIDALFGIGIKLPLRDDVLKILRTVKQGITVNIPSYADVIVADPTKAHQLPKSPKPFIYAIDCPSGLDCNTGEVDPNTIPADETITFIAAKPGMFTFPGAGYVGKLITSQIGIPDSLAELAQEKLFVIDNETVRSRLPLRPADGHKGTFGKVFIVAGSANYIGAAGLCGTSAYRSGSGLVTIASSAPVINALTGNVLEPTYVLLPEEKGAIAKEAVSLVYQESANAQALLIGPGLGQAESTRDFLLDLLKHDEAKSLPPLIIDADALNLLSKIDKWWELLQENTIITPHPGEMSRLSGIKNSEIASNRWELVQQKAKDWNIILVLKGAHTLVAAPDGQIGVTPFKTDALSTAGTGDVLAGLIAGLRGQGLSAFDSALAGSYIHALAGTLAIENVGSSRSVIASDVLSAIGKAFKQIES